MESTLRSRPLLAPLALLLMTALACGGPATERGSAPPAAAPAATGPRDVVLITADTLRHDATGFSGSGKVETPMLDRLAAGGAVFTSARAHAVVTLPSHASILTGLEPFRHGIHDNAGFVLSEGLETLAGMLRRAGWTTAAFVSALPLDRRYGLDRGFDLYDDEYEGYGKAFLSLPERPGEETVARALNWWRAHEGRRRFLWVHLFTPHFPYAPSEPFASRYRDAPYYGDVAMMDAQLEPLLAPWLDGTEPAPLVVFTSDHGESLGEHGERTHGTFAYDSTLKVPLIFWAPDAIAAERVERPAWHVDLVPTILELLSLPVPTGLPGGSLFGGSLAGEPTAGYFEALAPYYNRGWAPLTGRMVGSRKAIRLPLPELYDLGADPDEQANLVPREGAVLERLLVGLPPLAEILTGREAVDVETLARLRSLGYAAGNADPDPAVASDAARDPKNLIELEELLDTALTSYREGRTERALALLRDLLRRQPDMRIALAHLANMLVDLGRPREAVELLSDAARRGVADDVTRRSLALAHLRTGRPDLAWGVLAGERDSRDPETLSVLGRIRAQSGRPDEARELFQEALRVDPTYPAANVDLAILDMMAERYDRAEPVLERALERDPYQAEGWNALGVIRSRRGDAAGALQAWERAVDADPRLPDALYNLAMVRARAGALREAADALRRYSDLVEGQERRRAQEMLNDLDRRIADQGR